MEAEYAIIIVAGLVEIIMFISGFVAGYFYRNIHEIKGK